MRSRAGLKPHQVTLPAPSTLRALLILVFRRNADGQFTSHTSQASAALHDMDIVTLIALISYLYIILDLDLGCMPLAYVMEKKEVNTALVTIALQVSLGFCPLNFGHFVLI